MVAVSVAAVALGVLFPVFGVSLLVVLGVEAALAKRRHTREPEVADDTDDPEEAKAYA